MLASGGGRLFAGSTGPCLLFLFSFIEKIVGAKILSLIIVYHLIGTFVLQDY